jgi:hypothetical protein
MNPIGGCGFIRRSCRQYHGRFGGCRVYRQSHKSNIPRSLRNSCRRSQNSVGAKHLAKHPQPPVRNIESNASPPSPPTVMPPIAKIGYPDRENLVSRSRKLDIPIAKIWCPDRPIGLGMPGRRSRNLWGEAFDTNFFDDRDEFVAKCFASTGGVADRENLGFRSATGWGMPGQIADLVILGARSCRSPYPTTR